VTLGTITGMTYGMLAIGLVLVYRSNRIINFGHVPIGVLGASLFALVVEQGHVSYWIAWPFAIAISAAIGAVSEMVIVGRLARAPAVMTIVATLGLGAFLATFALAINQNSQVNFPQPPGLPHFSIGGLEITTSYFAMLVFTPVLVIALAVFMRKSRYGLAIRAAADNPDAARVATVSPNAMSVLTWAIAGALSAYAVILILPTVTFAGTTQFSAADLLRALAAAVIGRMTFTGTFVAGIGIGIVEEVALYNTSTAGPTEVILFVAILVALLLQRRASTRTQERGSYLAIQPWSPLPEAYQGVWMIRRAPLIISLLALVGAGVLPLILSYTSTQVLTSIVALGMVGISIGMITGLGGFISLGQVGIAAVGATASYYIFQDTNDLLLSILIGALASAGTAVVIGLPALRIPGLMLAVTTLAFGIAAYVWLLPQSWMLGAGVAPNEPTIAGHGLGNSKQYYYFALAIMVVVWWLARNIWKGGVGRRLIALRDNEDAARSFSLRATTLKLQVFAVSGFIAGVGGALYLHSLSSVNADTFPLQESINVVAMAALGGVGLLAGPIVGAFYILGVPAWLPLDNAGITATSLGWLIIVLQAPGGIVQIFQPVRTFLADLLARRAGLDTHALRAEGAIDPSTESVSSVRVTTRERPAERDHVKGDGVLLEAKELVKSFGGVQAVSGVSFTVAHGETLGLIGPNGAGKTTLFELMSGFSRPDKGTVTLEGTDITHKSPEARAQLGLIRSFQDVRMFPTMSVLEALQLAQERVDPTRFASSVLGWRRRDRRQDVRAREIAHIMGLERYRNKRISELSTGTRHIAELACLIALEPRLLLLDEPSSGVAQREVEALGDVLIAVKEHLQTTLVLIEHDMPLILGLSDRVIAMDYGVVVAQGSPDEIRKDPKVIESYLGTDLVTIQRSGSAAGSLLGSQATGSRTGATP
jgi:ABC-type branched-subunit amino acid transport system ATPase component/ABC-type branched-subunit amino acid transport system permease subunit